MRTHYNRAATGEVEVPNRDFAPRVSMWNVDWRGRSRVPGSTVLILRPLRPLKAAVALTRILELRVRHQPPIVQSINHPQEPRRPGRSPFPAVRRLARRIVDRMALFASLSRCFSRS